MFVIVLESTSHLSSDQVRWWYCSCLLTAPITSNAGNGTEGDSPQSLDLTTRLEKYPPLFLFKGFYYLFRAPV